MFWGIIVRYILILGLTFTQMLLMHALQIFFFAIYFFTSVTLPAQTQSANNILQGRVLYQSSGNKPVKGVQIKEKDSNGDYSKDKGEYRLTFQTKRNGASLALEVGHSDGNNQKLELVNEKEVKSAKLPAGAEAFLEIIVCPAGQRDIAAQKYYRILRTTADRELEKKKAEVEFLLAQKERNNQKIGELFTQLDQMQAALDSAKIREQAFNIASINLDRASKMVQDAVRKIEEDNDVEGALKILNVEALDTAYQHASALKQKAESAIRQVIEGYEFKVSLLKPQYKYGEVSGCYEKIVEIYEKEHYDRIQSATYLAEAAVFSRYNGDYQKTLEFNLKALAIRLESLPSGHRDIAVSYNNTADIYDLLGNPQKGLELNLKALAIYEKATPMNYRDLGISYNNLAVSYRNLHEYQKSLELNLKALAIREKALPADDIDVAMSYNNLSDIYSKSGKFGKQLEYNLKALDIYEKILPANHPDLANCYTNLAISYGNMHEHDTALTFALNAVRLNEKILPGNHPNLATSYNNLAWVYRNLGNHYKQLEFNQKALAIYENVLSPDHPLWVHCKSSLSSLMRVHLRGVLMVARRLRRR